MVYYEKFRILVDQPAERPALGFDEAANGLAGLIRNSEPQFAIAIFGPWGSGKTTLMQAIRQRLTGERVITVDFSAWRYEKEEHLIIPLLDTIRAALVEWSTRLERQAQTTADADVQRRRKNYGEAARTTASTMGKVMASLLAGLSFKVGIPGALDLAYDANKALSKAKELGESDAARPPARGEGTFSRRLEDPELPQSIYHACFSALSEAFQRFDKATRGARIVVFVDDLDRCLPAGTLQVLESMKLFFDLRGFVFVVGLDREVVERCIDSRYLVHDGDRGGEESGAGHRLVRGADYLKKIFQVPYSLAPVSLNLLGDLFRSLKQGSKLPPAQMQDLENVVRPHLTFLFSGGRVNPREVKRYLNAYIIQMKVKHDLDPQVVLALNTVDFRQDCRNLSDAIATFREETTAALGAFFTDDDPDALGDVGLSSADLPADVREYLAPGGIGNCLLTVQDLGSYLDAGAAARSTSGGYFLELLASYRRLRSAVMRAVDTDNPKSFDAAWSEANSHYQSLTSGLPETDPDVPPPPEVQRVNRWLDAANQDSKWQRLLRGIGRDAVGNAELAARREEAREEARAHLAALQSLLRERRRRANLQL